MTLTDPNDGHVLGRAGVGSVLIQVHPDQSPSLLEAGQTLAQALSASGIQARAEVGNIAFNINTDAVHVLIGRRQ
jgi:hypothetical protein